MDTNGEDLVQGSIINGYLIISKLEAARRQLDSAIFLYFEENDPVSIHTLTAAAYNILRDISAKRDLSPMMVKGFFLQCIKPEYKIEMSVEINDAENFFKHANRDPERIMKFNPAKTDILIMDACLRYHEITSERHPRFFLFHIWYMLNFPHHFILTPEIEEYMEKYKHYIINGRKLFFSDFLPIVSELITKGVLK
jgi:hypothetical protein